MWTVTLFFFFFFNDTATTEIYTLSLHRRSSDLVKALEHVLEVSKKLGFKTVNVDNYVGYAEFGTGEEYITALGHVDVVPEGDGWIHPPYAAEIHDGKLYGRGALDDKGPIIATLYGAKAIMDLGLPISKRIRIIFGTSEEIGSD